MPFFLVLTLAVGPLLSQAHRPTPTPRPSPSPVASATPSPTVSPAPAPSPSSTPVETPTPTPSATPSPSPEATPTAEAELEIANVLAQAESHFVRRSIGTADGIADRREIDEAIALYRKALESAPHDIVILARLLRAMQFRGAYTGASLEEKKTIFENGRKLGQDAVDRLEAEAKTAKGMSRIEALRLVKGAPALYLWTIAQWGEWGLVKGKFAAARSGIAGKLRDLSQTVIDMDPLYEDAAGYRTLGRLHAEAPKIPFVTGWVSHDKGVQLLRRANQAAPNNPITLFFLGEAILDHEPEKKDEAIQVLETSLHLTPRAETELEDAHYSAMAARRLQELRSEK